MNKNHYIELLLKIEENGIINSYDVSNFMIENFQSPRYHNNDGADIWDDQIAKKALYVLQELLEREYIKFNPGSLRDFASPHHNWFDNTKLSVKITTKGIEYLKQWQLIQSNLLINEASIRNFEAQKKGLIITITIAVLAFFATVASVCNSWTTNKINAQKRLDEKHHKPLMQEQESPKVLKGNN